MNLKRSSRLVDMVLATLAALFFGYQTVKFILNGEPAVALFSVVVGVIVVLLIGTEFYDPN